MSPIVELSPASVLQRLERFVPAGIRPRLKQDQPLHELQIDSLDLVQILCAIDEEFAVPLSPDEFAKVGTFGDLAELIAQKVKTKE